MKTWINKYTEKCKKKVNNENYMEFRSKQKSWKLCIETNIMKRLEYYLSTCFTRIRIALNSSQIILGNIETISKKSFYY